MAEFAQALNQLPHPLWPEVAHYWEALQTTSRSAGVELPVGPALESLVPVWACSEFVARACICEPALLAELWASGDWITGYPPGGLAERLERRLADAADEERLASALRRFRRREMVRIAWRDLAGLAGLTETLGDLTDLADAAVNAALNRLYAWQGQRYGVPRDAEGQPQQMVVLGMGKLGGRELNFSSDIDLISLIPAKAKPMVYAASAMRNFSVGWVSA